MAESPIARLRKTEPPAQAPATQPPVGTPPPVPPAPAPSFTPVPSTPGETAPKPGEEAPAPPKPRDQPNRPLQFTVEAVSILVFLAIAIVPLARVGLLDLGATSVTILVVASLALSGAVVLFEPANFRARKKSFDEQLMRKYRKDLILTSLSIGGTFVLAIMAFLELAALLAFLGAISRTSEASIAFADNYLLFSAFTLLYVTMLIIVRTSFDVKGQPKPWQKGVAYGLLAVAAVVSLVTLLVNYAVLNRGPFQRIQPGQSIYIFTVAALVQIIAFKILLRYPPISQIVVREIDAARRANKEMRDVIQKRALRAYFGGLAFVLLSMFLLGGVATQRIEVGAGRPATIIIASYLILGALTLGFLVTRYFQHRYLAARAKRQVEGDLIAKRRLSKEEMTRRVLYTLSIGFAFIFTVIGLLLMTKRLRIVDDRYATDFFILAFLVGVGPYGWLRNRHLKRIRALDNKFPDFLRDLAESERAGMTLPRALLSASKGVYGALTPEIRRMSAQVEWGVSFTESLQRFARRVKTPLIDRTVALIVEASKAGGNVIDILTAAADDAREIKQILDERKRQMSIYGIIIYISFFVFLIVVYILAAQFLPAFSAAAGHGQGAQVSGASIQAFSVEAFNTVFFHAALVQGIGGGLVSGIMQEGHPLSGLKHSVIMVIVSWFFFRILVG